MKPQKAVVIDLGRKIMDMVPSLEVVKHNTICKIYGEGKYQLANGRFLYRDGYASRYSDKMPVEFEGG